MIFDELHPDRTLQVPFITIFFLLLIVSVSLTVKAVIEDASAGSDLPVNASLINVELPCSESGWPCSVGFPCLKGHLGVYCQCYERSFSSDKVRKSAILWMIDCSRRGRDPSFSAPNVVVAQRPTAHFEFQVSAEISFRP